MNNVKLKPPVLGVIYGNRDFFPDQLVTEARADIAKLFAKFGIKAIQLGETDSKLGGTCGTAPPSAVGHRALTPC